MSDKAARMLLIGMLAIAAAILLGQGIYNPPHTGVGVLYVGNKYTGTVKACIPELQEKEKRSGVSQQDKKAVQVVCNGW